MAEYPRHDGLMRPGGLALTDRLVAMSGLHGGRVLDIGCGSGAAAAHLAAMGFAVVGVDRTEAWDREHPACRFLAADAAALPFDDASFDGVIAECTLSVMPTAAVLAQCHRVLRRDGKLLLSDLYDPLEQQSESRLSRQWWMDQLRESGFRCTLFEDQSDALRAYVGRILWETGSLDGLRDCMGETTPQKPGYFTLVADRM